MCIFIGFSRKYFKGWNLIKKKRVGKKLRIIKGIGISWKLVWRRFGGKKGWRGFRREVIRGLWLVIFFFLLGIWVFFEGLGNERRVLGGWWYSLKCFSRIILVWGYRMWEGNRSDVMRLVRGCGCNLDEKWLGFE